MQFLFKGLLLTLCIITLSNNSFAAQVDTVEIHSVSMNRPIRCLVITPSNYPSQQVRYPVVYLLHGWSGHYASWLSDAPQLLQKADEHQILIVCPDGGYDSWYLDSPVDSTVRYETHICKEVTQYIDYYYRSIPGREGRAIAGLSMGGHGAVYIASRHPEVFGAAGSICGGLDLRPFVKNGWDLKSVLGGSGTHWQNWEDCSSISQVPKLQKAGIELILDCGDMDFFLQVNRAMHQALLAAKVPHEYTERPGDHNAEYWRNAVDFQLLFFDKFFEKRPK
jgi:S-formylglutathione hydrolase FrmB